MDDEKLLDIKLIRYNNIVLGKILYQDDRLRDISVIINTGYIKIKSSSMPELAHDTLFIRGQTTDKDDEVFQYAYKNALIANTMCKHITQAVDTINKNLSKRWSEC